MLNILKTLTGYLLKMEEKEEESCAIPDESINDWYAQVNDELEALKKGPHRHHLRIEQLEEIRDHLGRVKAIREHNCDEDNKDA